MRRRPTYGGSLTERVAAETAPGPLLRRWLIAFSLICAAGVASNALPHIGARLPLPVLPAGIAVGLMYRWGHRLWPAILAASMAVDLLAQRPLLGAFTAAIGLGAGAVLTVWMLDRGRFDRNFQRSRDVPAFIIAAAAGMGIAATFGMLAFELGGSAWEAPTAVKWIRWWSNTTAGVLLVGPMIVAMSRESLAKIGGNRIAGGLWLLGVAACCAAIVVTTIPLGRPLIVTTAMALILIGAFRFGLVPTATAALAFSATAAFSFAFGRGEFANFTVLQGLVTIWAASAALTSITLATTALLAERDAAALERLRAEHRYAQIFEANPQPLWVHDAASRRFLLVNEAALRQYGWTREEFLALGVEDLRAPGATSVLPESGEDGGGEAPAAMPFETRHRRRDQRAIDVEVSTRAIDLDGRPAVLVFANDVTERRALGSALVEAIAGEQRRIGQEVHDGLGQELTGLALSAQALVTRATRERLPIAADLVQVAALATSCIRDARRIVQGLTPISDADGSLEAALAALARRTSVGGIAVRFRSRLDGPLALNLESRNHLYRIAQEALQNALKHAAASAVAIELHADRGAVRLTVEDDGRGIPGGRGMGLGMRTMRFRASAIGGRLAVGSRPGGGTSVVCEVRRPDPEAVRA